MFHFGVHSLSLVSQLTAPSGWRNHRSKNAVQTTPLTRRGGVGFSRPAVWQSWLASPVCAVCRPPLGLQVSGSSSFRERSARPSNAGKSGIRGYRRKSEASRYFRARRVQFQHRRPGRGPPAAIKPFEGKSFQLVDSCRADFEHQQKQER